MDDHSSFERRFYLDHFRDRTVVVAQHAPGGTGGPGGTDGAGAVDGAGDPVEAVVELLSSAGVRVVLVRAADATRPASRPPDVVPVPADTADPEGMAVACWVALRDTGRAEVVVPADRNALTVGTGLASSLRAHKLVLVHELAPSRATRAAAFVTMVDGPRREEPVTGAVPGPERRVAAALAAMGAQALEAGVGSVNACRPGVLEEELLTYEGAGILLTREQYCTVGRLAVDEFAQAERLVEQGVAEGFLKPRPAAEVGRLLLAGYGARFGDDHLAGFAALLRAPYGGVVGEVSALTTISRFAGGGVGGMIVRRILADAREAGMQAVFAATTSPDAAGFFRALGFADVGHDQVPAAKWAGYDVDRRAGLVALRHELGAGRR